MTSPTILITGASGFTGRRTVEILREKKYAVRALVRTNDERADRLRQLGADVVVADLLDLNAVRAALEGIKRAYFVYPIAPGLIEATAHFALAAREAGVESVVNMSQISARRVAKSHAALNHYTAERVFDWSGLDMTHLRPTYFAQWLIYPHWRKHIVEHSEIRLPFGSGRHAPIAAEDQARLIAAILEDPQPHKGRTYPLYGPVELNQQAVADEVGRVLGRDIKYVAITLDQYRQELQSDGLQPFLIQHLLEVAKDYQQGVFAGEDSIIGEITGQPPMAVQAFVTLHKELFSR
ncbi:NmrA family NAD(P)-binding protein [Pseudomonas sp. E102]|uniref:NmrA family NAD(P)-binding protein n=1 Tax=Pseudomonas sp. E102 TaxID=181579 RepID=UPI0040457780